MNLAVYESCITELAKKEDKNIWHESLHQL